MSLSPVNRLTEATIMDLYIDNQFLSPEKSPEKYHSRRKFIFQSVLGLSGLALGSSLLSCTQGIYHPRRPVRTEYNTIAHRMLDIELIHIQKPESYETLEQILTVAEHFLGNEATVEPMTEPERAVFTLTTIDRLLKFFNFEYQTNSLLAKALETRKIDCDGYSAVYLAVGEVLGLPIKMVRAPAHTFVRWQLESGKYINWETTIGAPKSNGYYIAKHKIAKKARGRSALRSLDVDDNRNEILANSFVNVGVEWLKKMQYEKALICFEKAVEGDPLYEAPYYNMGLVYFHMGDMGRAVAWCEVAVSLNPNHMKSHAVLGTAYKELHNSRKAKLHFRRVRELDPEYYAVKIMEMQLSEAEPPFAAGTL